MQEFFLKILCIFKFFFVLQDKFTNKKKYIENYTIKNFGKIADMGGCEEKNKKFFNLLLTGMYILLYNIIRSVNLAR